MSQICVFNRNGMVLMNPIDAHIMGKHLILVQNLRQDVA